MRRRIQGTFLMLVLMVGAAQVLTPVEWRWPCWICRMFPGCSLCPDDDTIPSTS